MTQPSSYSGGKRLAKFEIKREENIINAVIEVTKLAEKFGFRRTDMARIATCVSEIGWNILIHAGEGQIEVHDLEGRGLEVVGSDKGPGIHDIGLALTDGFSTSTSLGIGLPGIKRMMDEFNIDSQLGKGTVIKIRKWLTDGEK